MGIAHRRFPLVDAGSQGTIMLNELYKLIQEHKSFAVQFMAIFIILVVWIFGYIFSRGRTPPNHPNGNKEDLVIPLWNKKKDEPSEYPKETDD